MEPFIALSMIPRSQDGFLRMTEVLDLKLNADLVALTACQTGHGKIIPGEGVISLGRAFQCAGARSTLVSLWSVSEITSVKLMEMFFERLKEGEKTGQAWRKARLNLRSSGYDHPFFWAPFIMVGQAN
jgi:CHAT domain-containing protein